LRQQAEQAVACNGFTGTRFANDRGYLTFFHRETDFVYSDRVPVTSIKVDLQILNFE
jgi:hypothetical protein